MADRPDTDVEPASAQLRRPRVRQRLRTPLEARQMRRRVASYAVFAVSFVLVVNALVGENGYLATMRARREQADLTRELRQIREDNSRSQEEIRRLKEDPAALEDAAREKLHMSKPGETMIVIKEPPKPKTEPAPAPNRAK